MADVKSPRPRPLSPHLQIYRPMLTMMMSIFHRITGSALYFGTLLFAWWLIAAASGPEHFALASAFFGSWIGRLVLFFYTWALIHHMLGGLRHLFWDTGSGFEIPTIEFTARAAIIGSLSLTLLVWLIAAFVFGV